MLLESREFLIIANYFLFTFHSLLIIFNMVGWIIKKTRKIHLVTICLTCVSWFFFGIWYGIGYCFCTDWHWKVRKLLGYSDFSRSYIHFLILKITGININEKVVDIFVVTIFFLIIFSTVIVNSIDFIKYRKKLKN